MIGLSRLVNCRDEGVRASGFFTKVTINVFIILTIILFVDIIRYEARIADIVISADPFKEE